jgi:fluoroquinolone resistance protein
MQEFICDQDFVDIDYSVVKLHKGTFDNVVFKNCLFNRLALNQFVFIDCSFIECDLSLISVKEATFRNVTFSRCKVIGVQFFHCNNIGLDLHFSECLLDHSSFYAKTMKG